MLPTWNLTNDKHNVPLRKANTLLHDALIELGKSDWISVKDGLPEYRENVLVCDKNGQWRTDYRSTPGRHNDDGFIKNYHVTHWRRIEKLEE